MRELAGRLDALDADAGSALRAVTYFDELVSRRAGLESVVRGAAILSGYPARLVDQDRGLRLRITPDGVRRDQAEPPAVDWCRLDIESGSTLWLELPEPAGSVQAVVLERAVNAARSVFDRTRSRTNLTQGHRADQIELVLDSTVPETDRLHAVRLLGLPATGLVRVAAFTSGRLDILASTNDGVVDFESRMPGLRGQKAGIGTAVLPKNLPGTEVLAITAARFTADGDEAEPGPRVVYAERLGGLLLLARAVDACDDVVPDVVALERAAKAAPWVLSTLEAISTSGSLRVAATRVQVHHSTLQGRLAQAERRLGWSLKNDEGRTRLYVALMLRRLYRNALPRRRAN